MLGYRASEWLANPSLWSERIHRDDRPDVLKQVERCLQEEIPVEFEYRSLHRDDRVVWLHVSLQSEGPGSSEFRGIATDITQRKALQEQFLQAQKMEAVGQLAGGVAHDFNNLLTVINGFSELILAGMAADDPNRSDLEEILNAGTSASNLTRQLLTFSRKQITRLMTIDLNELIGRVGKMLDRLVSDDVKVAFTPGPGPLLITADPSQIEQVILNLAVNARDAMLEGGKIVLETSATLLDETLTREHPGVDPGPFVVLRVTDSGTGMPDEVKAHLFEPFFTTKELGKGTGLGLSTVHEIVKSSRGMIAIESVVGRGTTFCIYLPQEGNQPVAAASKGKKDREERGGETVLLAEDDETVLRLARVVLEGEGYEVLSAMGGAEAIRLAETHEGPIHLLLTDVVMRSMSGLELARILKREHPETRVLFMSGYVGTRLQEVGEAAAFLQKPFTLEALKSEVRGVLDEVVGA